jgi:hypothetical protein
MMLVGFRTGTTWSTRVLTLVQGRQLAKLQEEMVSGVTYPQRVLDGLLRT